MENYTVATLLDRCKKSELYRDKFLTQRAIRNIRWYNGNYGFSGDQNTHANIDLSELNYYVNLAFSTSRTIVSSIYNRFPEFSFYLRGDITKQILESYGLDIKFQNEKLERVLELICKIYFKEMQARRTNRLAITDAVLLGFGVTKLGYNVDFDNEKLQLINEAMGIPDDKFVELASNIEVSDLVKRSEPYLLRVNPLNMLFPTTADGFNRIPWQAEVIYKPKEEAESMYGVKGKLSATYRDRATSAGQTQREKPDMVKLYEYHSLDPEYPKVCVFSEGYDKFLEKKDHPLYNKKTGIVKNMYNYVWFNESYDSIYPMSDIDLVAPQISEANFQVEKRVEHVRKFVRMYSVNGPIADEEMLKLKTGADGTVIQFPSADGIVNVIPYPEMSVDFYNNIAAIRNEIYETLGLTDYSASVTTQNRKATEAQLMERSRIDRVQERIDIIEEFCYAQVDTFVEIMKEYQQLVRAFNLQLGDEKISMVFAGELMKMADIGIQVIPGSTISLDRDAEIRRMERLSTILVNANMAQPGLVKMGKFFKDQLSKMGYAGGEYINEDIPLPLPPGIANNVPKLPGAQSEPMMPTQTPMQGNMMPNMMTLGQM